MKVAKVVFYIGTKPSFSLNSTPQLWETQTKGFNQFIYRQWSTCVSAVVGCSKTIFKTALRIDCAECYLEECVLICL